MPKYLVHEIKQIHVNYERRIIRVLWVDGQETQTNFTKVSPGGLILLATKRLLENERNNAR